MKTKRHVPPPVVHPVAAFRRHGETVLIDISIRQVAQLYNSFDPSPFHERELDDRADAYVFAAAREIGADKPFKLVIHMPSDAADASDVRAIESAIRNHFLYRLQTARRDLRHELRRGRTSLMIGLAFLIACQVARELALVALPLAIQRVLSEGLLIIGWVAMWGPLEVFLYGWWPIARTCRILERLASIDVELCPYKDGIRSPSEATAWNPRDKDAAVTV